MTYLQSGNISFFLLELLLALKAAVLVDLYSNRFYLRYNDMVYLKDPHRKPLRYKKKISYEQQDYVGARGTRKSLLKDQVYMIKKIYSHVCKFDPRLDGIIYLMVLLQIDGVHHNDWVPG